MQTVVIYANRRDLCKPRSKLTGANFPGDLTVGIYAKLSVFMQIIVIYANRRGLCKPRSKLTINKKTVLIRNN